MDKTLAPDGLSSSNNEIRIDKLLESLGAITQKLIWKFEDFLSLALGATSTVTESNSELCV